MPPLLATCQQIHDEAGSLFYSETKFAFDQDKALIAFIRNLTPSHRRTLTQLKLDLGMCRDNGHAASLLRHTYGGLVARGYMVDVRQEALCAQIYLQESGWAMLYIDGRTEKID